MRTPTPDLDELWTLHGTGPRFANGDDNALRVYEARTVDVSWVAIDQVVRAIMERDNVEPSPYLFPPPPPPVVDVTGADLRNEMSAVPSQGRQIETAAPVEEPPKKKFWSRIYEAARG